MGHEVDLVREVQWPELESGTSMGLLAEALNERGIHTFGLQLSRRTRLKWRYPVLVHVDGEGGGIGHFVVRLPSSSDTVILWCGVPGVQRLSDGEFAERSTGAVLLTGPGAIRGRDVDSAIKPVISPGHVWCIVLSVLVCIVLIAGVGGRWIRTRFAFSH